MILGHTDYRTYLKSVIAEKRSKNPSYSMRVLAKQLGLTQATISMVLSGKRNLSPESALKITRHLGLNDREIEYFCTLVQFDSAKGPTVRESLAKKLMHLNPKKKIHELSVEFFRLVADWYHFAIRNLLDVDGFELTATNAAKKLGITRLEAEAAIDRLERLELIEKSENNSGQYQKTKDYVLVKSHLSNEALRHFHSQMLQKASESLTTQTTNEKIVGSETFAFNPQSLKEANELTEEYFEKMKNLSEKSNSKTEVYHLGVQFFNLTKGKR